ncbi:hypothetical protein ACTPD5_20755, partial [Clostridioides difficile]|uniref:hypothetical protein n=1 Tax=Clostridioides difficile TaxID=1496 RepID=UPI003F8CF498
MRYFINNILYIKSIASINSIKANIWLLIESVAKFPIESIKLYDNNDERQRKVAEACAIIVREKNPEI